MAKIKYYRLEYVEYDDEPKEDEFRIATAAVLCCDFCCNTIDGMNGGNEKIVMCEDCFNFTKCELAPR